MNAGLYVVIKCAILFIDVIAIAMTLRAVMSWIFMGEENRFMNFLYVVTEPIILPVRLLCRKLGLFQGLPFDMSFFLTVVLLMVIQLLLETFFAV